MGDLAMSRYWAILPALVMIGAPIWTDRSGLVIAIEGFAALLCAAGMITHALRPVTAGAIAAMIGYAVAAGNATGGADIVSATVFGLALLSLLDLSEFTRRHRGAVVSAVAWRGLATYWLARGAVIAVATAVLVLCAAAFAAVVPGSARAVVAGAGALLAFAGALRAGIGRPEF
jgi:hypothetical protein